MRTKIIKLKDAWENLEKIAKNIRNGKIVVIPTETCYGFATNGLDIKAVRKIYKIKKEPKIGNILVFVPDLKMASKFGILNKKAKILVEKFMPGPLTIIVKRKKTFPKITNVDFAFRISGNNFVRELCKKAKVPITGTSANIHGEPSIYSGKKIIKLFKGVVDLIIDAGELKRIKPSTVIDLRGRRPKLIREGPISFQRILKVISTRSR
jgi:L-threonylcarbamoyladenylate synthase